MPDLLQEVNRVALMETAGCDPLLCGLSVMSPRLRGITRYFTVSTITHHRRSAPTGKATVTEAVRALENDDTNDDLAAWIREQHGE